MARFFGSTRRMGTQSAVWTPRRRPGRFVAKASPRQGSAGAALKRWMISEWICFREMSWRSDAAAVFQDVFPGVPIGETEIEDSWGVLIGDSAKFGAEPVDNPGQFGERSCLQDSHTLRVAFDPVRAVGRDRQRCLPPERTFAVLAFGFQCFRGSHNLTSIIPSERRVSEA